MKDKVELLAPAGDMEKLKAAIKFGANAVYMAGNNFGLRKIQKILIKMNLKKQLITHMNMELDVILQ